MTTSPLDLVKGCTAGDPREPAGRGDRGESPFDGLLNGSGVALPEGVPSAGDGGTFHATARTRRTGAQAPGGEEDAEATEPCASDIAPASAHAHADARPGADPRTVAGADTALAALLAAPRGAARAAALPPKDPGTPPARASTGPPLQPRTRGATRDDGRGVPAKRDVALSPGAARRERVQPGGRQTPEADAFALAPAPPTSAGAAAAGSAGGLPRAPSTSAPPVLTATAPPALPPFGGAAAAADGAILRSAAHLRIAAPGLGEVELHLRVRDGVAHLRVDGDGARVVEARAADLSRALAGEGLELGHLEVKPPSATSASSAQGGAPGHGGSADRQREEHASPPPHPGAPPRRTPPTTARHPTSSRFGVRA